MKKISVLLFIIIFLVLSHVKKIWAIPSFGTVMPKSHQWQAGTRVDIIFNRDIKDYKSAKADAYYYKASYGFCEWFSFDGLIGIGGVKAGLTGEKELRYPANFSGGYGIRAKIYKNKAIQLDWVVGFQHVSTHPANQWYKGKKYQMIWDEWQLSTAISKRIWNFIPYCGLKWSFTYLITKWDNDRHRRLSNGSPLGVIVGSDFRMNDYIYLNLESRFFDETALNTGFTIRY